MTIDNQKLGQDTIVDPTGAVDFAFLRAQTFQDTELERDVLELFVAQARAVLPGLPQQTAVEQADAAHLLKGSARGIGAWLMADAAERYEATPGATRPLVFPVLMQAFASAEIAILARLAVLQS